MAQRSLCCSSFLTTRRLGILAMGAEMMVVSSKNLSVTVGLDVPALDRGWSRRNQVPDQSPLGHVAQGTHGMRRQSWCARYEACRTFVGKAPSPRLARAESAVRPCPPPRHPGCLGDELSPLQRNSSWTFSECTSMCTSGKVLFLDAAEQAVDNPAAATSCRIEVPGRRRPAAERQVVGRTKGSAKTRQHGSR
jgi:hypothetical protein